MSTAAETVTLVARELESQSLRRCRRLLLRRRPLVDGLGEMVG